MAKKNGFKKFITILFSVILSITLILAVTGICVYNFVIVPKYNQYINSGEKQGEKLSGKDIITFAKLVTDKQLITNLANLDKQTAKDVLSAMLELEEEIAEEATPAPTKTPLPFIQIKPVVKDKVFTQVENSQIVVPTATPAPTPAPTPFTPPKIPDEIKVSKEQQSAYDRIMAAASKEEIQAGMAIIAKIDIGKVNALNSAGKTVEMKKYIKSVLTASEISTAGRLYRKYKHLL